MVQATYSIFSLGDSALTIDFGNCIDEAVSNKVLQLFGKLQNLSPHIIDVIPAYSSLTVYYHVAPLRTKSQSAFEAVSQLIEPILNEEQDSLQTSERRQLKIPVCYTKKFAPDLEEIAAQKNIAAEDVIQLHTALTYRVYMIGFLPGFAYMGKVDSRIATPRKAQPRTEVPAGAVGIAGAQTGIYPLASPGGWNIIGQTPLKLFDATAREPVLLRPGDEISFYSITEDEFKDYQGRHT